jgi:purine-binding chemotaxis protein CheW
MTPQEALPAQTSSTRHFLMFKLLDRHYAVPAEEVAEVIRIPSVVRLPHSPRGLLGLANLRGTVLPVASGRGLLRQKGESDHNRGRAIVLQGASPVACSVDGVTGLAMIEASSVEMRREELAALPGEVLAGAFQPEGDGPVVKVLDVRTLLHEAFTPHKRPQRQVKQKAENFQVSPDPPGEAKQSRLLAFTVARQDYALPLEMVQEVVTAPPLLMSLPHSEALVLGVTSLRDVLLPLLSLRGLLGFGSNPEPEKEKVVVVKVRDNLVGLVVDDMRAIIMAEESRIDVVPQVLAARAGGESRIAAIFQGSDGGLLSILSPEQIFGNDVMQRLSDVQKDDGRMNDAVNEHSETEQYLVFRLGDEEFGIEIGTIEEVARVPDKLVKVPKSPTFLEGVMNLRGEVVPVIDQRKRFQMPRLAETFARRLVVVRTGRHVAGLIVDSVSEVLRTSGEQIDAAPDYSGETARIVTGVVNLVRQYRIILLLDPAELLTRDEQDFIDQLVNATE